MTTNTTDTIEARAFAMGEKAGRNAAEWFCQDAIGGRAKDDGGESARTILEQIEDGDPAFWDNIKLPNLSGEWADSETPATLAESLGIDDETEDGEADTDAACNAWEDGVSSGFTAEVERQCRLALAA
jgi:hypothetical protein